MTIIQTTIRNRRIEVPAPTDLPDGTHVVLTIGTSLPDDGPMSPEEIARVLAAMRKLEPQEMPAEAAADLYAWEQMLNKHGIENADRGIEQVFQ